MRKKIFKVSDEHPIKINEKKILAQLHRQPRVTLTIPCAMVSCWSRVSTGSGTPVAIPLKRWGGTPGVRPITIVFIEITTI